MDTCLNSQAPEKRKVRGDECLQSHIQEAQRESNNNPPKYVDSLPGGARSNRLNFRNRSSQEEVSREIHWIRGDAGRVERPASTKGSTQRQNNRRRSDYELCWLLY